MSKNNLICPVCGRAFHGKPSAIKKGKKYCSKACHDKAQSHKVSLICESCGKPFQRSPCLVHEHNFCCNACRLKWLSAHDINVVNVKGHSAGHKAPHLHALNEERNPKLAIEPDAFRRGNYNKYQHRKTMEKVLGRKLLPNEDVHHINGIHDDDRPENLIVMRHRDHMKLHWKLAREKGVV